jgi:hypothetical protein
MCLLVGNNQIATFILPNLHWLALYSMAKRKRAMGTTEMMLHTDRKLVEQILGSTTTANLKWFFQFAHFYHGARQDYIDETYPKLQALQVAQYPLTAALTDPAALAYMKDVHEINASSLIWKCKAILDKMHNGLDVKATYPKLEEWRAFYCTPQKPKYINRKSIYIGRDATEETIRQQVRDENIALKKLHGKQKALKDAYYEVMQPLLFHHLPALHNLEGDFWVLYAVTIGDAYDQWKSLCEQMDTTIEYAMPQESITWEYAKWHALFAEKYSEKHRD